MRRSVLAIVLCVMFSAAMLQAQRGGGGPHGAAAHGGTATRSVGATGLNPGSSGLGFSGRGTKRPGNWNRPYGNAYANGYGWPGYYGGYGLDGSLPYWDYVNFPPTGSAPRADNEVEGYNQGPPPQQMASVREVVPATPVQSPKLIEVPLPNDAVVKPQPPALFVLTNGEKLESRRYVLSADSLQIDINRKQRTIPISQLNVDATIAANQQRGLDVSIPQDRSSLFVGF
jgi:hypothetical protein